MGPGHLDGDEVQSLELLEPVELELLDVELVVLELDVELLELEPESLDDELDEDSDDEDEGVVLDDDPRASFL